MSSNIPILVFTQAIPIPGTTERESHFARCHGWQCEVRADGTVRIAHASRTMMAPFVVVGVGFSYRTDDDVPVKAAKKVAA